MVVILGLIFLSLILACGGGPNHFASGFYYWQNPGAFNTYLVGGDLGRFLGFWSTLTTAVFAYLGTELVGVTVGECQNPRRVIPRAIKLTFYRILLFYVVLVLLLGMILPYNSSTLISASKLQISASSSPFVVAIQNAGIPVLPQILNACIMMFVFSAANSGMFAYLGYSSIYFTDTNMISKISTLHPEPFSVLPLRVMLLKSLPAPISVVFPSTLLVYPQLSAFLHTLVSAPDHTPFSSTSSTWSQFLAS